MESELFNSKIAMDLIAALKLLKQHGITSRDEAKDLQKRLEKLIENENYIISKPFRTCHAEMKTAYNFMMCLKRKFMKDENENR